MGLPTDSAERKNVPVWSGFVVYFPDAIVAVAQLSKWSDRKHNPEKPLDAAPTWAKEKSTDEPDAGMRHAIEPLLIGGDLYDQEDGFAHVIKKAWRAMAEAQRFLEAGNVARAFEPGPGGLRIPCAGAPLGTVAPLTPTGEALLAAFDANVTTCAECHYVEGHHANCSENFKRPAAPDETLYATKSHPLLDGMLRCAATAKSADQVARRCVLTDGHPTDHKFEGLPVEAVFCKQCGAEAPMHFSGCLSRAANGGM